MSFHVYRCKRDQDIFIVTDDAHADQVTGSVCPTPEDGLEKVGVFSEMGKGERAAFDEILALNSIESQATIGSRPRRSILWRDGPWRCPERATI